MSDANAAALAGYLLTDTRLLVGGRMWTITSVPDQDTLIDRVQNDSDLDAFPYGLLLWTSAVALAEQIADTPERFQGKRVLELGAGAGLPGLIARMAGAWLTQTDYQTAALHLARLNAEQNGIQGIEYLLADWRRFPPAGTFDTVIGSDVLYERSLHEALFRLLPAVLAPGGLLLLSDPLRPQALDFIEELERRGWQVAIDSRKVEWEGMPSEIALFKACLPGT